MHARELERWLNPDWRARLIAWWEGYDIDRLQRHARSLRSRRAGDGRPMPRRGVAMVPGPGPDSLAVAAAAAAAADEHADLRALEDRQLDRRGWPLWSLDRVQGAQLLWGDDFVGPGDGDWAVDAVSQFGLNPAKSVLDVSAGLGGAARAIVGAYDTWVTGLEPSPVLAGMAMKRSRLLGLDRKAPVAAYDPEAFRPAGSYDLVMADRIVHRVRDKEHYLDQLCTCVKPGGGVLMMDYVSDGIPASPEAWSTWRSEEPVDLYPWTTRRLTEELTQRNMDVRVAEDLTLAHRWQILERVRDLARRLEGAASPDGRMLSGLARELALWWARLRVLGRGLSFVRFVALRPS
ncbi:class I SAM-dependent methyltransferase [Azospirillum halopraeferens]|uniref:class I SAM-dependent methyltransferase n=1 Tax=Azospirillum halopraeferens TaxID=34010 RepID=UPI000416F5DA|nr:methyltransferase domain-containing protein [Azospirillum halopraeferens]